MVRHRRDRGELRPPDMVAKREAHRVIGSIQSRFHENDYIRVLDREWTRS